MLEIHQDYIVEATKHIVNANALTVKVEGF